MVYSTRSTARVPSPAPTEVSEDEDPHTSGALKVTLGLYHAPSLPTEITQVAAASQESKTPTVINLLAEAGPTGLGLGITHSMVERFEAEQMSDQAKDEVQPWNTPMYFQAVQPAPPTPIQPQYILQPLSGPPTPATTSTPVMSYYSPIHPNPNPYGRNQGPDIISPNEMHAPAFQDYPYHLGPGQEPELYAPPTPSVRSASISAPASVAGSASTAVGSVKGKGRKRTISPDEKERRAEHRRQINRKSARNFREKRKAESDQRENELATAHASIARLQRELDMERAERIRLQNQLASRRR